MSTLPGRDAWRDAGLAEPDRHDREARELDPDDLPIDDAANLLEEALAGGTAVSADSAEEYRPGVARPDLSGQADEADVAEQAEEVPGLDEDGYTGDEPVLETPGDDVED
ncbi:hypothetical protein Xcel_1001 [Xylanimonas cellulosilytica DSM 15894]|uniref:DUF5709 domain-containing protein n=1 Tax=Xylanimonas cellulosilytica (strain DSM 15894 / JCM 12276 / CECT 5975 / KCTC 9989 / LMG 20990 / NBRC 107835 / XIL07) TaxID=446471 RepID=D1BYV7_XYLCX|nr:hypothetical protein [Xylanimonas cellulosilytica]ACZ30032.1 hypothetical protein Xcel_1001 [Xylanimonas cellulosilytica DSM 15894]